MKTIDKTTTMEDLTRDPSAYGLPTFEEFKRNPGAWRKQEDEAFALLDRGSINLRSLVKKYIYEFNGHQTSRLEVLDRMIRDAGYLPNELEWKPEIVPIEEGKCKIVVKLVPKVGYGKTP